jgi:hypothetical protein
MLRKNWLWTVSFCLLLSGMAAMAQKVELKQGKYSVEVMVDGRPWTTYRHTPDPAKPLAVPGILQTKPVLYPVFSPSGTPLARAYPFEKVAGEDMDHPHHQGIFFTVDWVGSKSNLFWGNSKAELPAIRHQKILAAKSGKKKGTIKSLSQWIGTDNKALLEEERQMDFLVLEKNQYAIDFNITLKALDKEVAFGDTKEGMFALRVAQFLTEKATGRYLNSNGQEMEKGVWGKRANWVRLQGEKEGKKLGVAILSHPSSVNSPTYWHARGYGCFSVNPLGQLDFQKANKEADAKAFGLVLKPGEKAIFRYRVLLFEGDLDGKAVEAIYQKYIKP